MFTTRFRGLARKLDWQATLGLVVIHLLALAAAIPGIAGSLFSWSGLNIAIFLAWLSGWIGVTLCFHRLLTHRSFETPKWFEYFLTICGTLSWQGGPVIWVATHRKHHAHSDEEDDPHSPIHGLSWAHVFWTTHKQKDADKLKDFAKDLLRDPWMIFINRLFWVPQVVVFLSLLFFGYFLGGVELALSWIVWGVGVRTTFIYHLTWAVNSACHTWGYRNFQTEDLSTNFWPLGALTGGEAFHNNHHADPRSARHGMLWWEFDPTWLTIKFLSFVGLAWDIKLPRPSVLTTLREKV